MSQFKIGDRVRCVKVVGDSDRVIGFEGSILRVNGTSCYTKFDSGLDIYYNRELSKQNSVYLWIHESAIELAVPLTEEEKIKQKEQEVINEIKRLDEKFERRMKIKKERECLNSSNMSHAPNVGQGTTLHGTGTGVRGASAADIQRMQEEYWRVLEQSMQRMWAQRIETPNLYSFTLLQQPQI